ncbi:hypothetical protein U1Q18_020588 [Sarracenia purpurea var. burkii]
MPCQELLSPFRLSDPCGPTWSGRKRSCALDLHSSDTSGVNRSPNPSPRLPPIRPFRRGIAGVSWGFSDPDVDTGDVEEVVTSGEETNQIVAPELGRADDVFRRRDRNPMMREIEGLLLRDTVDRSSGGRFEGRRARVRICLQVLSREIGAAIWDHRFSFTLSIGSGTVERPEEGDEGIQSGLSDRRRALAVDLY